MSKNIFNSIKLTKPKRNVFDLSHDVKLSFNPGELIPILALDCVPGDSFSLSCQSLLRFAPLVFPMMHRVNVSMHYFFVPNRILWDEWEQYITGNTLEGPNATTTPVPPFVTIGGASVTPPGNNYNRLADYMGIPDPDLNIPTNPNVEQLNALPFAAYQKIWNDYYRDQNLIGSLSSSGTMLVSGDNTTSWTAGPELGSLRIRAWEHDYFTSALPWAQKGSNVEIPLGRPILDPDNIATMGIWSSPSGTPLADGTAKQSGGSSVVDTGSLQPAVYDPNGTLIIESTSINDLRRSFRLQEWLEKNARAGTRYTENILAHFGVKSSDKRLQRPEYITGTVSPVVISEVLNTTGTDDLPQGNMAGHGVSVTSGKYGRYYCEEHGWIIGIISVMPRTAYQQGIPRSFLRGVVPGTVTELSDRFAYYWPEFANIGEQAVLNRELFAFQVEASGAGTFGYVPRYAEYKYMPSRVAGDFRRSPFNEWHWGRIFATAPALNKEFVECVPDHRIFAIDGDDPDIQKMYCHVFNKIKAVRPMPKFGTPSF